MRQHEIWLVIASLYMKYGCDVSEQSSLLDCEKFSAAMFRGTVRSSVDANRPQLVELFLQPRKEKGTFTSLGSGGSFIPEVSIAPFLFRFIFSISEHRGLTRRILSTATFK